jgi:hypothetical protein
MIDRIVSLRFSFDLLALARLSLSSLSSALQETGDSTEACTAKNSPEGVLITQCIPSHSHSGPGLSHKAHTANVRGARSRIHISREAARERVPPPWQWWWRHSGAPTRRLAANAAARRGRQPTAVVGQMTQPQARSACVDQALGTWHPPGACGGQSAGQPERYVALAATAWYASKRMRR